MAFTGVPVPSIPRRRVAGHAATTCGGAQRMSLAMDRREALKCALAAASIAFLPSRPANAAMYSADTKAEFAPKGDLSKVEAYLPQIEAGFEALQSLEKNWDAKTKGFDGDVVRRILGSVGLTSPLFNIRKSFLRAWQITADTYDDYSVVDEMETEWNNVLDGISAIDYQMYSVSFTELEESKMDLISKGRDALRKTLVDYEGFLSHLRQTLPSN